MSISDSKITDETATVLVPVRKRNSVLPNRHYAMALSVVPGLGHFYIGKFTPGLILLFAGIANSLLMLATFRTNFVVHRVLDFLGYLGVSHMNHGVQVLCPCTWIKLLCLALNIGLVLFAGRHAYMYAVSEELFDRGKQADLTELWNWNCASYILHFSLLVAVLFAILMAVPPAPRNSVTMIELVVNTTKPVSKPHSSLTATVPKQAARIGPAPRQITPARPQTKQTPSTNKKIQKSELMPKDKPLETKLFSPSSSQSILPAPANETEIATTSAPTQDTGIAAAPPSSTGSKSSAEDDFDISPYLASIWQRIKGNWHPPRGIESRSCTIKFKVRKNGSVEAIQVWKSSGSTQADEAAELAVKTAAPFPELPAEVHEDIDIKFSFDYNIFKGRKDEPD